MPYPMPKIQDMLLKLEGFQWATALNLNMGYYNIRLDDPSKKLYTLIFPWGKYEMQSLPMGLYNGPDVFFKRKCWNSSMVLKQYARKKMIYW